jgi:hypothetical protein
MFNFFRKKPKSITRMDNTIWRFYFEELQRAGKSTDDQSVFNIIILSFVAQSGEKGEAMCKEGYRTYGRGAIVHVPMSASGKIRPYQQAPSNQFYIAKTHLAGSVLQQHFGSKIIDTMAQDMDRYEPDKEYISGVVLTFDNEKPTPLDLMGWIIVPY